MGEWKKPDYIIEEILYVHDNEIYSYLVDIENGIIKLFTRYCDTEETLITFTGMKAHYFENVIYSNIIIDISQITMEYFIQTNKSILERALPYGFPVFAKDIEEMKIKLERDELKIFYIESALGLCGFVIAKEITVDVKFIKKENTESDNQG